MKTIIVFRVLVACLLILAGMALAYAGEQPYDVNAYRTGTLEQVGQVDAGGSATVPARATVRIGDEVS